MFTGIIQGIAKIISINDEQDFRTHVIKLPDNMINNLKIGSSVAQNGCCLTVVKINGSYVSFNLIQETLSTTNLGELMPGDIINVERAAKFSDEIGGHLMSGHITTIAKVEKIIISKNNRQLWFKPYSSSLMKYIFNKGFIGIDGISLTIGELTSTCFCVYLIPETIQKTTIGKKKLNQNVNIEIDFQTKAIVDTIIRITKSKRIIN